MTGATLSDLRDLIGDDATAALMEAYGGQRLYIALANRYTPASAHALEETIGAEPARALRSVYGGETIYAPNSLRFLVRHHHGKGMTTREIAQTLRVSRDRVRRFLR